MNCTVQTGTQLLTGETQMGMRSSTEVMPAPWSSAATEATQPQRDKETLTGRSNGLTRIYKTEVWQTALPVSLTAL